MENAVNDLSTNIPIVEILNIVVPFLSALIMFYLSCVKEKRVSKSEIYKERIQNFYIPFYKMYCRGFLSDYSVVKNMPIENRRTFLDLFSNNLQYMDCKTQSLYPKYYQAFLDLMEAETAELENLDEYRDMFANTFYEISKNVFAEYKRLLRKLRMPVPDI